MEETQQKIRKIKSILVLSIFTHKYVSVDDRRESGYSEVQSGQSDSSRNNKFQVGGIFVEYFLVGVDFGLVEQGTGLLLLLLFLLSLLPLYLVELNDKVVDMIEGGDLVHGPELLQQTLLGDEKREYPQLELLSKHSNLLSLVMLLPDQVKVDIPKVDDKEIKILRIIVLKALLQYLVVLIPTIVSKLILHQLQQPLGQLLQFLDLSLDLDLQLDHLSLSEHVRHRVPIAVTNPECMLQFPRLERLRVFLVKTVHFLLKLIHHKLLLHSEHIVQQGFGSFVVNLLYRMDFRQVQNHVVKVVDEVEPEELLKKSVLELGKQVDIALLTVPCLQLVFCQFHGVQQLQLKVLPKKCFFSEELKNPLK